MPLQAYHRMERLALAIAIAALLGAGCVTPIGVDSQNGEGPLQIIELQRGKQSAPVESILQVETWQGPHTSLSGSVGVRLESGGFVLAGFGFGGKISQGSHVLDVEEGSALIWLDSKLQLQNAIAWPYHIMEVVARGDSVIVASREIPLDGAGPEKLHVSSIASDGVVEWQSSGESDFGNVVRGLDADGRRVAVWWSASTGEIRWTGSEGSFQKNVIIHLIDDRLAWAVESSGYSLGSSPLLVRGGTVEVLSAHSKLGGGPRDERYSRVTLENGRVIESLPTALPTSLFELHGSDVYWSHALVFEDSVLQGLETLPANSHAVILADTEQGPVKAFVWPFENPQSKSSVGSDFVTSDGAGGAFFIDCHNSRLCDVFHILGDGSYRHVGFTSDQELGGSVVGILGDGPSLAVMRTQAGYDVVRFD